MVPLGYRGNSLPDLIILSGLEKWGWGCTPKFFTRYFTISVSAKMEWSCIIKYLQLVEHAISYYVEKSSLLILIFKNVEATLILHLLYSAK